jgi:RNA polymerase sigma factor (sigma-70 family)
MNLSRALNLNFRIGWTKMEEKQYIQKSEEFIRKIAWKLISKKYPSINEQDKEDIIQEVVISVFISSRNKKIKSANYGLISRSVSQKVADFYKKRDNNNKNLEDEDLNQVNSSNNDFEFIEFLSILDKMNSKNRDIFLLSLKGYSVKDISIIVGVSIREVKRSISITAEYIADQITIQE